MLFFFTPTVGLISGPQPHSFPPPFLRLALWRNKTGIFSPEIAARIVIDPQAPRTAGEYSTETQRKGDKVSEIDKRMR